MCEGPKPDCLDQGNMWDWNFYSRINWTEHRDPVKRDLSHTNWSTYSIARADFTKLTWLRAADNRVSGPERRPRPASGPDPETRAWSLSQSRCSRENEPVPVCTKFPLSVPVLTENKWFLSFDRTRTQRHRQPPAAADTSALNCFLKRNQMRSIDLVQSKWKHQTDAELGCFRVQSWCINHSSVRGKCDCVKMSSSVTLVTSQETSCLHVRRLRSDAGLRPTHKKLDYWTQTHGVSMTQNYKLLWPIIKNILNKTIVEILHLKPNCTKEEEIISKSGH